eukprot:TRINITY_DN5503_c0_g1_i1.p1 TRINITY_DN5503_c0_g1~~TRINITY_DN5503_c0_g1_i1.p1  ORF type:complete len:664 (-),score=121.89 TRINITY_DN5503_c0_g1_i1:118-2109(-)
MAEPCLPLPTKKRKKDNSELTMKIPPSYNFIRQYEQVAKSAKGEIGVGVVLWIIFQCAFLRFSKKFSTVIFFGLLSGSIVAYSPQILGHIINNLYNQDMYTVMPYICLIVGLHIIQHFLDNWVSFNVFYISTQVEDTWRFTGVTKYFSLPLAWHDVHDSAKTINKIMRGGGNIWYLVCWLLGKDLFSSGFSFFIVMATCLYSTPQLWWLWITPPIFFFLANKKLSKRAEELQQCSRKCEDEANKLLFDTCGNVRLVKAFHKSEVETKSYSKRWGGYHESEYKEETLLCTKQFALRSAEVIFRGILISYCWGSGMSVGDMTVLLAYQQLMLQPLRDINDTWSNTQKTARKVIPLFELVRKPDALEDIENPIHVEPLHHEVCIDNISFSYRADCDDFLEKENSDGEEDEDDDEDEDGKIEKNTDGQRILQNVSLTIRAGTTTALVGRSGAGKTTLVMLLLRFYDPSSGSVKWDGTNLKDTARESIRKQMAWVPQEALLFNRTIAENIAYGYPDATRLEIISAAKRANAHNFILETIDGYESVVGERGVQLSGGQRQRVAIARALLSQPSLIVLDECTSQLDSESEKAIQDAMGTLRDSKITQVVIAHRLSTVLHADQIVVMDKGKIVAVGKHKELLETCALYTKFYTLQFKDESTEVIVPTPTSA